jgi:N-acetylmuramoyl-L-alanine amidase
VKVASFGKVVLCFLVLFSFIFSFDNNRTEAAYSYQAKVTVDVLNVRSQPGTAYSIVGKLSKSQVVTVLEQRYGWSRINYGSLNGWVSSQYITPVTWSGYVTATNLNLRSAPGGSIIGNLKNGTSLTVHGKEGTWLKVFVPSINKTGWVAASYVTSQKPVVQASYPKVVLKLNGNLRKGPSTSYPILSAEPAGTFLDKLKEQNGWVQVRKLNGTIGWVTATLVRDPATVLRGKVIVVDAGHGGFDSGTRGRTYLEKTLTLRSALELTPLLQRAGAKVILTRNTDVYLTLAQRVNISNYNKANAFISLHYNAYSSTSTGVLSFYYNYAKDAALAQNIQSKLAAQTKLRNLGARYGNYQVLRNNTQPAVLVELGFLSNPIEEKLVATSTYQRNAAQGIYNGIFMYFLNR